MASTLDVLRPLPFLGPGHICLWSLAVVACACGLAVSVGCKQAPMNTAEQTAQDGNDDDVWEPLTESSKRMEKQYELLMVQHEKLHSMKVFISVQWKLATLSMWFEAILALVSRGPNVHVEVGRPRLSDCAHQVQTGEGSCVTQ
eukprot:3464799-Amphidinium_carterae.1